VADFRTECGDKATPGELGCSNGVGLLYWLVAIHLYFIFLTLFLPGRVGYETKPLSRY
jgi:hypothetical protein